MALPIATIPVLEGKEAERFVKMAQENLKKKDTIDMSQAIKDMREIIAKSKRMGYF
ncbi:MAG: hypothetical protein LUD17_01805 [Bacteroidales bacterium]|nr:hypothetical protein [Bacteroidales bacterium]MCD8385605.1 hypothetical protein [Bacteroidales bacterium]